MQNRDNVIFPAQFQQTTTHAATTEARPATWQPPVRRTILQLSGRAKRVEVVEDRTNGVLLYDVITTNMWNDAQTIVTGIFGQAVAIKMAREQIG